MSEQPVTFINVFTVPSGEEARFLERWHENAAIMRDAPGLVDFQLHRSLDATSTFRFINIAHWESRAALEAAQTAPRFRKAVDDLLSDAQLHVSAHPATYAVAEHYVRGQPPTAPGR